MSGICHPALSRCESRSFISVSAMWLRVLVPLLLIAQSWAADPVPAPTLVPTPGAFSVPVVVGVKPAARVPQGTTYRYTLDGTDPTATSWLYEGGILLTDSTVVRISAFAAGHPPSTIVSGTYQINFPLTTKRPVFSIRSLAGGQSEVTLSCPTVDAEIVVVQDGSDPSCNAPRYSRPLVIATSKLSQLRARAYGGAIPVVIGRFTVWLPTIMPSGVAFPPSAPTNVVPAPSLSLAAGRYPAIQQVTASDATDQASIRYTRDGSDPTESSALFPAVLTIDRSMTVSARAFRSGWQASPIVRAAYELQTPVPTIAPAGGILADLVSVTVTPVVASDEVRVTSDGTDPTAATPVALGPIQLIGSTTIKARAYRSGWSASEVASASYSFAVSPLTLTPPPGYVEQPVQVVPTSATSGVIFRYALGGAVPTESSPVVPAGGIPVDSTTIVTVIGYRAGFAASQPLTATYHLPEVSWSQMVFAATEGTPSYVAHLHLSEPLPQERAISLVVTPGTADEFFDFRLPDAPILLPAGVTDIAVPITIVDDAVFEGEERSTISLAPAPGVRISTTAGVAALVIADNDARPSISFTVPTVACSETDGPVPLLLHASGPSSQPVSAVVTAGTGSARPGIHFLFEPSTVLFEPFQTEATTNFTVLNTASTPKEDLQIAFVVTAGAEQPIGVPNTCVVTIRSETSANPVVTWNERARTAVARTNTDPPMAARIYGLVGVAQRRAVMALPRDGVSPQGAVVGASLEVLTRLFPAFAAELLAQAQGDVSSTGWGGIAGEAADTTGSFGRQIGAAVIEEAASDGANAIWLGAPPIGPQYWFASWPYPQPPLRALWGQTRPWFLTSGSEFRPGPPPAFGSSAYQAALQEVRAISDHRTAEQLAIAGKWADGAGSPTPSGTWVRIADDLILRDHLDVTSAAKLSGLLCATMMDAGIACWDAKYAYWLIRPYQADRSIITPVGQPNFPSYVSGHSAFSGAAAEILAHAFPADAAQLHAQAEEAALSRLYGGIHYRFDNENGLVMGRQIAAKALAIDAGGTWTSDRAPHVALLSPAPAAILTTRRPVVTIRVTDDRPLATGAVALVLTKTGSTAALPVTSAATPSEDGRTVQVTVQPTSDLADGLYALSMTVVDADGLSGAGQLAFGVDPSGAPVVTITTPREGDLVGMTVPVHLTGLVSKQVPLLTLNSTAITQAADGSFAVDLPIDPYTVIRQPFTLMGGINELYVRAVDEAGLAGGTRVNIRVDDHAPTLAVEFPANGSDVLDPTTPVIGRAQDIVLGQVTTDNITVTVNGQVAAIRNGTFQVSALPLVVGSNQIRVTAVDQSGNASELVTTVNRQVPAGNTLKIVSGSAQEALPHAALSAPLVVRALNGAGAPIAHQPVRFAVTRGDGLLSEAVVDDRRDMTRLTDTDGRAEIHWEIGGNAGIGNQRVTVTAPGIQAPAVFTASVIPATPVGLFVIDGDMQTGFAGQPLYRPLVVVARDRTGNPVPQTQVDIDVTRGSGLVAPVGGVAQASHLSLLTDADGFVRVILSPGSELGPETTSVRASIPGTDLTRSFVASVIQGTGRAQDTGITGVVLSTEHHPLAGVTLVIEGTTTGAVSDQNGAFTILNAPSGHRHLMVMGTTANTASIQYPTIGFEVDLLAGGVIHMPMPIYLPTMDRSNEVLVGGDQEVTITIPGTTGAQVVIAPHSTIRADGTRGPVWMFTSPVNALAIPMTVPGGSAPLMAATLQPSGTRMDPPAKVRWPNFTGLPLGFQVPLLSFDHDLGQFVSQGTMTVQGEGQFLESDPGTGLTKAGWHVPDAPPVPDGNVTCPFVSLNGPMFVKVGQEFKYSVVVDKVVVPTDWEKIAGETADVKLLSNVNGVATFVALKPSVRLTDCVQIYGKNPTPKSTDKIGKRLYIAPDSMDPVGDLAWIYDEANDEFKWNAADSQQAPPWWSIPYSIRTAKTPYSIAEPFRYLVFGFDHPDSNVFAPAFADRCDDEILKLALQSDPDGKNFVGSMVRNKYIPAITRWLSNYDIEHLTITYSQNGVQKSGTIHRPEVLLTFLQIVCSDKKYDGDIDAAFDRFQKSKQVWASVGPQWKIDETMTVLDAAGGAISVLTTVTDPIYYLKGAVVGSFEIEIPEKGKTTVSGVLINGGMVLGGGALGGVVTRWVFKRLAKVKPLIGSLIDGIGLETYPGFGKAAGQSVGDLGEFIAGKNCDELEKFISKAYGGKVTIVETIPKSSSRGVTYGVDVTLAKTFDMRTLIDEWSHVVCAGSKSRGLPSLLSSEYSKDEYASLCEKIFKLGNSAKLSDDEKLWFHRYELANAVRICQRDGIALPSFVEAELASAKTFCGGLL